MATWRSSGVSRRINWRAAALGNSSSSAVRSSGDISFRMATTCSCAIARNNFCCSSIPMYSKTSAASAAGRTRKMITCSSSGISRITSATSAGGHSRKTSRSAVKLRASIRLLISGSKILPTMWRFYHSRLPKATPRARLLQNVTKDARFVVNSGLLHLAFAGNVPKLR